MCRHKVSVGHLNLGGQEVVFSTTLASGITDSATSITLTDASQFPTSGTNFIQIGTEEISYTGITSNTLSSNTRCKKYYSSITLRWSTVTSSTNFVAWGEAASGDLVIEPGFWSLDNFGDKAICLICTVVFEWDSSITAATSTRQQLFQVHLQHQDTC